MPREKEGLAGYLTKPPTDLQVRFADWIREQVGYDPTAAKNKLEAFEEGVRIATATRMVFQASPENKAVGKKRPRVVSEPVADDEPEARPAKTAKKASRKAAPPPVEEDDEPEAEIPPARKAAKKAAPAKRARRAAPVADDEGAPF